MFMTDHEIAYSYKTARSRAAQVTVLAELNGVPISDMQEKLVSLGFREAAHMKKRHGGRPQVVDPTHLKELYSQGLTDAEIALKMGVRQNTVTCWRKRTGLTGGRASDET